MTPTPPVETQPGTSTPRWIKVSLSLGLVVSSLMLAWMIHGMIAGTLVFTASPH